MTDADEWMRVVDGGPVGPEPELICDFAAAHDATVEWTVSSEQRLVEQLEQGRIDLVAGGIRPDTPWSDRASTTMPYTLTGVDGGRERLVMLAPLGENGFVLALDRHLQEHDDVD